MLGPSASAPDYEEEKKRYEKDPSSWGIPHTEVDMMKSQQNAPQPGSPQAETAKKTK